MHITLVSTSYPVENDGSEAAGSFVADFARDVSQRVPVTVVAPARRAGQNQLSDQLEIRLFRAPRLPLSLLRPANPLHWPLIAGTLRAGRRAVQEAVRSRRSDYVMALWVLPSGYWARIACAPGRVPFATWALGSDIWSLGRLPVVRGVLASVLREADRNYADGLHLAREVEEIAGTACEFLPSSRDLGLRQSPIHRTEGPWRLAFLGRWHVNKGVDLLLDALDALDEEDWALVERFDIAGGGPLEKMVRRRCAALAQRDRPVRLQGYLDRAAARSYLSETDFVVIPSRIESIPVVFSDCLQARCSIIATPVGDLPELMTRHPIGQLCSAATARDIADGIRRALRTGPVDPGALAESAELFSVSAAADTFLEAVRLRTAANESY